MGILFSRKVQKGSKDVLRDLEKLIQSKTQSRRRNQQYERSFVSYLLLLSFGLYLTGVAVLYLYFRPTNWVEWLVYLTPLVFFPIVVYMIKKLLNLYFSQRKAHFNQELSTLYEEKRRVLNEVMEKETYKTAIELLQRYEPTHPSLQHNSTPAQSRHNHARTPEVKKRVVSHPAMMHQSATPIAPITPRPVSQHALPTATPIPNSSQHHAPPPATPKEVHHSSDSQPFIPPGMCLGAPPGPPTPCPILPRNRSRVDKVVEYLVGDGPNNRYALVCQECHSHNGMALRDEFEYISFRCAYCFQFNPARKKKPTLQDNPDVAKEDPSLGSKMAEGRSTEGRPLRQRKSRRDPEVKESSGSS